MIESEIRKTQVPNSIQQQQSVESGLYGQVDEAKKYEHLSLQEAVENPQIKVMDKAAIAMAAENSQSIMVFELLKEDNIARAVSGEAIGTIVD